MNIRKRFKDFKLVEPGVSNLWEYFIDGVLRECDVMRFLRGKEIREANGILGGGMRRWKI